MTPEETIALLNRCKAAQYDADSDIAKEKNTAHEVAKKNWNEWAHGMIESRKTLEAKDEDTRDWELAAAADFSSIWLTENDTAHFEGFIFPSAATFRSLTFHGSADFSRCVFYGEVDFRGATFFNYANFESANFHVASIFQGAQFYSNGDFRNACFGNANTADFNRSVFHGVTEFRNATFNGYANFERSHFHVNSSFQAARFNGSANFGNARFSNVDFKEAIFSYADFTQAAFGNATFEHAVFTRSVLFRLAEFNDDANFQNVEFNEATFEAKFRDANFESTIFKGNARFSSTIFSGDANFSSVDFFAGAFFVNNTIFLENVSFGLAEFKKFASFENTHFFGDTNFGAIRSVRAFDLADAIFEKVPDFIQAHFEEAPRLDNIKVRARMIEGASELVGDLHKSPSYLRRAATGIYRRVFKAHRLRDLPARWRALKRLAIQGHDNDREHEFFSREVQAGRFTTDSPFFLAFPRWKLPQWLSWLNWIPFVFWRVSIWAGFFRFWFGLFYEMFSNLGRSVLRPFLIWGALIVVFAVYFLGQSPDIATERRKLGQHGFLGQVYAYSRVSLDTIRRPHAPFCFPTSMPPNIDNRPEDVANGFTGLVDQVRKQTNLVNEALSIAYHNAVIVLDNSGDSAHRSFGCLYGVERYGGNPVVYVPRPVAIASGIQKLLSAVMIFLFGLALRNMLKMK